MMREGTLVGGKYRLERAMGSVEDGELWSGWQIELNRPVIVRVHHQDESSPGVTKERFLQNAHDLEAVNHPNAVQVVDHGETDDGAAFLVTELLDGLHLADRVQQSPPLTLGEFLYFIDRALAAVEAVHGAGLCHGNIQAQNLFLVHDEDGELLKLTGFSLACEEGEDRNATLQARQRRDLVSIGAVLQFGLLGTLESTPPREGEPELPSLRELRPDLNPKLTAIVERALDTTRAGYTSARDMKRALTECRRGLPTHLLDARLPTEEGEAPILGWRASLIPYQANQKPEADPVISIAIFAALALGAGLLLWALL